jgi:hypothetical protein
LCFPTVILGVWGRYRLSQRLGAFSIENDAAKAIKLLRTPTYIDAGVQQRPEFHP